MASITRGGAIIDLGIEVIRALALLPEVEIRSVDTEPRVDDRQIDFAIVSEVKGHPVRFLVEAKASGYPRDIQHAIWQLAGMRRLEQRVADVPLVAAPGISKSSRELLRQHKMAYWDSGGSLYVDLPWALYLIDRPVPAGRPRILRSPYRGSAAQVLHALLLDPDRPWHVTELAERTHVSVSTVHQVCTFLERELWMEMQGQGPAAVRVLRQPGALLDAWAAAHSLAEYRPFRFHRWTREPTELLQVVTDALASLQVEYALTLSSGAQFVAPYTTEADRVSVLVPSSVTASLDELAGRADLRPIEERETATLFATHERSPLLFRREVDGFWVASDVQLYLDLWAWPHRGKEQARHLRAERLGY